MALRHAFLPIGAVLVLGLGVYLFIAVRAESAPPVVASARTRQPDPTPGPPPVPAPGSAVAPAPPSRPPPAGIQPPLVAIRPAIPSAPAGSAAGSSAIPDSGPQLDEMMGEANKAYDRGDLDDAKQLAGRLLARQPGNVRMLRIMVSASCIDGDLPVAQASYAKLPPSDQEQMKARCARYGVTFP